LTEGASIAGQLNDLSYNQSLVLWHLGGVIRSWREFADGAMLSAAARPFGERWTDLGVFPKDPALAAYRNALSVRSSRHFEEAKRLLLRNAQILKNLESLAPGFGSTIQQIPIEDVICRVGASWGAGRALRLPLFDPVVILFAGTNTFRWDSRECGYSIDSSINPNSAPFSPISRESRVSHPPVLVRFDLAWRSYANAQATIDGAFAHARFYLPRPGARERWASIFLRKERVHDSQIRMEVGVEHPGGDEPASLLTPNWAPVPTATRLESP
jgi:hypothetical protein